MKSGKTSKICKQRVGLPRLGYLIFCAFLLALYVHRRFHDKTKISYDQISFVQHSPCTLHTIDWKQIENRKFSKKAAVFTPYALVPGGGERYLLTFVTALQELDYNVYVLVDQNNPVVDSEGLDNLAETMGISLKKSSIHVHVLDQSSDSVALKKYYDVFFSLGNSKFPQIKGIGSVNFYMCQFPFDLSRPAQNYEIRNLITYDYVLLNSEYSLWWYNVYLQKTLDIRAYHTKLPELTVLYPPVPVAKESNVLSRLSKAHRSINIVLLGRFFQGRQSKVGKSCFLSSTCNHISDS